MIKIGKMPNAWSVNVEYEWEFDDSEEAKMFELLGHLVRLKRDIKTEGLRK